MPCGWGVKAGMVRVWVAGKTVWSHCYIRAVSECFRGKGLIIKCYINLCGYFTYYVNMAFTCTSSLNFIASSIWHVKYAVYDGVVRQVSPYLPYEMTHEGMLRRISAYIQHQDFCSPKPEIWPPLSSVKVLLSRPGQSCKDACWTNSKYTVCQCMQCRLLSLLQTVHYRSPPSPSPPIDSIWAVMFFLRRFWKTVIIGAAEVMSGGRLSGGLTAMRSWELVNPFRSSKVIVVN